VLVEVPGLDFLGLRWQYTRGSTLLGWTETNAGFIPERIAVLATARARG